MLKKLLILAIMVILSASAINFAIASDPLNPNDSGADSDKDGLKNWEEYLNGTDPNNADSDNDGLPDGWEVFSGMDPADPTDARENMDYQVDAHGEIEAQFLAMDNPFDVRPSDGVTRVSADGHYDNYEEYYRAFTQTGLDENGQPIIVNENTEDSFLLGGSWVIFAYTDPQEPDTDGDTLLDPDDPQPHNFANDGTTYSTINTADFTGWSDDQAKSIATTQKYRTMNDINSLHIHDNVVFDTDLFISIKL